MTSVARLPRDWTDFDFETQRDHDRRELTERFANQRQTRTGAINELSALLDAEDERVRLTAEAIETARTEDMSDVSDRLATVRKLEREVASLPYSQRILLCGKYPLGT